MLHACLRSYSLLRVSAQTQTVWACCDKKVFGKDKDVILCATYIPPENGGSEQAIETQFAHFADELQHALNRTPYLISCGDFNAQIGTYDEITQQLGLPVLPLSVTYAR